MAILAIIRNSVQPAQRPEIPYIQGHYVGSKQFTLQSGRILVSPNTTDIQLFMENVTQHLHGIYNISYFDTDAAALDSYRTNPNNVVVGIDFEGGLLNTKNGFSYILRMPDGKTVNTEQLYSDQGNTILKVNQHYYSAWLGSKSFMKYLLEFHKTSITSFSIFSGSIIILNSKQY